MANRFGTSGNTVEEVAAAEITPGTFAFMASGTAKYYSSHGKAGGNILAGETCHPLVANCTVWILKENDTDTYAQGADVFGDTTDQHAETSGPADGTLGYAARASASGDTHVEVRLNKT